MPDFQKHVEPETNDQPKLKDTKVKSRKIGLLFVLLGMVLLGFGFGVTAKVILSVNSTNTETGEKVAFFEQLKHLILSPDKQLRGEAQDRVNILLIGIGGEGHQGAYLADTIILASIQPSTGNVAMLSIPRDLYVEIPEYGYRKINNAMAFGHTNDYPGGGEVLLSRVVSQVTGQQINYFMRIDFTGFEKIIDDLGGIWVDVERGFTDYQYPDNNFGYQFLKFEKGYQKMNGETALKYVRSRHGTNGEGSDFARSQRQQKVLLAIKDQGLAFETLIAPKRIISALEDLGEHNRTDLQIWEILRLAEMGDDLEQNSIVTKVLDTSPGGLLEPVTSVDGAYLLQPISGSYDEIHDLAENIFSEKTLIQENPQIEIQNGTKVSGLAYQASQKLSADEFTIVDIGNAVEQDHETTVIYDLTSGTKPYSLSRLKDHFDAEVSTTLPGFLVNASSPVTINSLQNPTGDIEESPTMPSADFLIVLGLDQVESTGTSL
ncbi:LCP family protein [Patescibacteria group bacterium]